MTMLLDIISIFQTNQ